MTDTIFEFLTFEQVCVELGKSSNTTDALDVMDCGQAVGRTTVVPNDEQDFSYMAGCLA